MVIQERSLKKFHVINRLEESKMKELINEIDPHAFITVYDVAEVKGGNFKKRDIHNRYEEGVPKFWHTLFYY